MTVVKYGDGVDISITISNQKIQQTGKYGEGKRVQGLSHKYGSMYTLNVGVLERPTERYNVRVTYAEIL